MPPTYELYSYFRSSCSARVRIAAHLKGIELTYKFIHLVKGEQLTDDYKSINPSGSVPTLIIKSEDGHDASIKQSVAILEYFEDSHPDLTPLLPPANDPLARARVRELINIIAADTQPVTNLRILQRVKGMSASAPEWAETFIRAGLGSYEQLASTYSGRYSVGDDVTLADVCLVPAVDGAMRFGLDMDEWPTVKRIYQDLQQLEAFQKGGWRNQPDTPEEFRPPSTKQ